MALQHQSESPVALLVRTVGSQAKLARLLGTRQSTVHSWLQRGTPLPAELVLKVEAATGISRHVLRPDIYPIEPAGVDPAGSFQSSGTVSGEAAPGVERRPGAARDSDRSAA